MTEAKPDDVKILCPKCFEICDYAYADPLSSVCLCVKCDKRFDLGDSYKAQLTAANARIAQLENPGQTNFCELCESAGLEVERLKAEQLKPIDASIEFFVTMITVEKLWTKDVIGYLKHIRAKYEKVT